ncbi:hypothetical protein K1719_028183 [Acacia pycnantha]|nr:hypothetical protein K1719_028183 [Acacia pycnantha]
MKEQHKAYETHLSNDNNVTPETHLCDVEHMRREQHGTSETYLNNSHGVYHGDCIQQNRSVPLVVQNQDQGCSSSLPANEDEFLNHGTKSPPRKRRVVWSGFLQKCFLDAVDELGGPDRAKPKPIFEKIVLNMHGSKLTRENVGSHLQKLRDRKKKDGELHPQISLFEPYIYNHSLADLPMQTQIQPSEQNFNNFGHGAPLSTVPSSLVGNGSNNLTSSIEELNLRPDSSRIPASGTYVTTTRVNPQVRNPFVSSMLQRRPPIGVEIGVGSNILHPHQNQNSSMCQLDRYVTTRGANNEGIQAMSTSYASNTGAQQLDRNLAPGSSSYLSTYYNGIINPEATHVIRDDGDDEFFVYLNDHQLNDKNSIDSSDPVS